MTDHATGDYPRARVGASFTRINLSLTSRSNVGQVIPYPLQLEPTQKLKYFEEREKFDPTVYLKNPMVLMGVMMAFMAFVMPKMVSSRPALRDTQFHCSVMLP